ncbi:hypothetical protein BURK1_03393 [Burkholderiales bacterium]|nr:hypothetical protein BURK1_03393 [Burkholderiales bacterium]
MTFDAPADLARLPGDPPPLGSLASAAERGDAESLVREFHANLDLAQRREICFDYGHVDARRGLLRAFVTNHWQVTRPAVRSDFYLRSQQTLVHAIFRALLSRASYPRVLRQLHDDCLGHPWGADQSVALFGDPSSGPFQFLFTGRHVTLRADGGTDARVAFGGPVLYAHTVGCYIERPDHPGNVYWPQALAASRWHASLETELARRAIVASIPHEPPLGFRDRCPGLPLADVSDAQLAAADALLDELLGHFREGDRSRVRRCLEAQGGLAACSIQFARDGNMSAPHWDNWRLEGPSFIWHWRGFPHVHVWVHVAADPGVPVNAAHGRFLHDGQDPLSQPAFPFSI